MNALILALVLAVPTAAPAAKPATLTDAQIRSTVHAYLGSIDTPIAASRWHELGARAEPELLKVLNGPELPTRRAKAIDGLASIATPHAPAILSKLAADESQPVNVRYASIRGLGRVLGDGALLASLQPLLEKAQDPRVRAKAGEVLTHRIPAASCTVLRAQIARESEPVKAQFDRAREGCLGH